MRTRIVTTLFVLGLTLALAGTASAKGLMSGGSFDIFSPDEGGGGWVINHIGVPGYGDTLWGCADVANVKECRPVPLPDFVPMTSLKFFHVDEDTQAGWLNVSVPIVGDFLMACYDPEGSPYCEKVPMELRPPVLVSYKREWPGYDHAPDAAAGGGGGPMAMMGGGAPSVPPEGVIEPGSKGDMWLSAGAKPPGPINLYACRDLNGNPECQLAIPDWFLFDRENIGFKKVEMLEGREGDPVGISIVELEEGSAAEAADLRPGDVIVKVAGFPLKNDKHFKGLLMQFPATYRIPVELENGDRVKIKVRRKPRDD